jgi:signal transduction histidine kinase
MNHKLPEDRLTTHFHRLVILISYLLIVNVALRRRNDLIGSVNIEVILLLLGLFILLFTSELLLSRRIKSYHSIYFALQLIIVQILGMFPEYQDTWALLFVVLGFQVAARSTRKEAWVWFGLFAASLLITLSVEFGVISGLGRALAYITIGVLLISYDIQYAQHEDALVESRVLLAELQEAHQKLAIYAAQSQKLAALQERNRMIQELYDSVGQKIFAIQLAAETTRLLLKQNPQRAQSQIEDLQAQTQSTLAQMRQLIGQWRPA